VATATTPIWIERDCRHRRAAEAKAEEEKERPGLTIFTDGSRLDSGAGYSMVWKRGQI